MIQYVKSFDSWNQRKQIADGKVMTDDFYFHEREVWWCAIGVNIGVEIDGKNNDFERPVLVIKRFNKLMFWGIPLTSKFKNHNYFLEVKHDAGISFANMTQLRLFSSKRMLRKIGMISVDSFNQALESLAAIFVEKNRAPNEGSSRRPKPLIQRYYHRNITKSI